MPTYEYACTSCRRRFEIVQKFTDAPLVTCEECGGTLKRVFHPVGVVLKGPGFYSTDNRGKKAPGSSKKEAAASTRGSSESGGTGTAGGESSGAAAGKTGEASSGSSGGGAGKKDSGSGSVTGAGSAAS